MADGRCFQTMASCGVQPEVKHCGCTVDMLGWAGLVEEAEELIRSIPVAPDVMICAHDLVPVECIRDLMWLKKSRVKSMASTHSRLAALCNCVDLRLRR